MKAPPDVMSEIRSLWGERGGETNCLRKYYIRTKLTPIKITRANKVGT